MNNAHYWRYVGLLPQGITVEDTTHGVSVPRNKLLFSNGIHLLPYTGAGSGLTRAQLYTPNIKFENNERLKEFVVTIWRDNGVTYGGVERIPYHLLTGQPCLQPLPRDRP